MAFNHNGKIRGVPPHHSSFAYDNSWHSYKMSTKGLSGEENSALYFKGINNYCEIPNDRTFLHPGLNFKIENDYTWSFWFKVVNPDNAYNNYGLMSLGKSEVPNGAGLYIYISYNFDLGSRQLAVGYDNRWIDEQRSTPDFSKSYYVSLFYDDTITVPNDIWCFMALTYNSTNKDMKIYFGQESDSLNSYGPVPAVDLLSSEIDKTPHNTVDYYSSGFESLGYLTLGGEQYANDFFNGRMYNFCIFDKVLDQSEIDFLYNDGNGTNLIPPSSDSRCLLHCVLDDSSSVSNVVNNAKGIGDFGHGSYRVLSEDTFTSSLSVYPESIGTNNNIRCLSFLGDLGEEHRVVFKDHYPLINGSTDTSEQKNIVSFQSSSPRSYSFWFYPKVENVSGTDYVTLICDRGYALSDMGNGWSLTANFSKTSNADLSTFPYFGNVNFKFEVGCNNDVFYHEIDINDNNAILFYDWNHCVISFNGNQGFSVYINNYSIMSETLSFSSFSDSLGNLRIGGDYFYEYDRKCFVGKIDDFRIYDKYLTSNEINLLYTNYGNMNNPSSSLYDNPSVDIDWIEIDSYSDFIKIGNDSNYPLDGYYKQTSDITFPDNSIFTGVGDQPYMDSYSRMEDRHPSRIFTGVYDGQNFKINNFNIISTNFSDFNDYFNVDNRGIGLFKVIGEQGVIKNVVMSEPKCYSSGDIEGASANGLNYMGFISGINYGIISNCIIDSNSNSNSKIYVYYPGGSNVSAYKVGTLVGANEEGGVIENCHSNILFDCDNLPPYHGVYFNTCGGLVGYNEGHIMRSSYDGGFLNSLEVNNIERFGGICGETNDPCCIEECFANIDISVTFIDNNIEEVGGLVGRLGSDSICKNCFSNLVIKPLSDNLGAYYIGGLIGQIGSGSIIQNCYSQYDIDITSSATRRDIAGFTGYLGNNSKIINCFSIGLLSLSGLGTITDIGNYIGDSDYYYTTPLRNCYAVDVGYDNLDGDVFDITHTTESNFYDKTNEPFIDTECGTTYFNCVDWDFDNVWIEQTNDFPILRNIQNVS